MTADDDAFLRTIVDNPGNDVPRLVYADWLDDRDDPRGPFLRAEVEWAQPWKEGPRPGDATELRAMAAGLSVQELELFNAIGILPKTRTIVRLDPLWVARLARPPLGCCCDHLRFEGSGPVLRRRDVDEIDRWPGVKVPAEYKAFLLNHNGGSAHCRAEMVRREQFQTRLERVTFWPIVPPGDPKGERTLHGNVQRYWDHYLPELLESWPPETDERKWVSDVIPIGVSFGEGFDPTSSVGRVSTFELPDDIEDRVPELVDWVLLGTRREFHPNTFLDYGQLVVSFPKLLAHIWGSEQLSEKPHDANVLE